MSREGDDLALDAGVRSFDEIVSVVGDETPARATVRFGFPEETITVTVDDQCRVVEFGRE
ncbi:hypothetical protein BRC62_01405 [Halobacteriales archaeon QH_10_67_13]|nr:MAG: hypothetical protein BRC62_01405 [Halobacteriales archaeon QH_10_67_13]